MILSMEGASVVAEGGVHGCRGVCMVAGGHAWLLGGMCGCQGVCMVAGEGGAWLWGVEWLQGGMRGCGGGMCGYRGMCGCGGVCMVAGGCMWLAGGV